MIKCTYPNCEIYKRNIQDLLFHIRAIHEKEANFRIKCIYTFCRSEFMNIKNLTKHIEYSHQNIEPNSIEKYRCGFDQSCLDEFENLVEIKSHLYNHLRIENKRLHCIFKNCLYASDKAENFKVHFSRSHSAVDKLKERFLLRNRAAAQIDESFDQEGLMDDNINDHVDESENQIPDLFDQMEAFYMKLYLKYTAKNLIPDKHVNEIFDDISLFFRIFKSCLISKLKKNFENYKVYENGVEVENEQFIEKFKNFLNYYSIYDQVHKHFHTKSAKLKWVTDSKYYVEPLSVKLPDNQEYHYVPILKSISSILNNDFLKKEYFERKPNYDSNKILDFRDSLKFKNNALFQNDLHSVQIRLYIDDFNLANPLGDAKNNLKYTCVYFRF
jgi:hypothetical protein